MSCTKEFTLVWEHPIRFRHRHHRNSKKNTTKNRHNNSSSSTSEPVSKWKLKIWAQPETWILLPSPSLLRSTAIILRIASSHPQAWITTSLAAFLLRSYRQRRRNRTTSLCRRATRWTATAGGRTCRRRNPISMKLYRLWPLHPILHWGSWIFILMNSTPTFNLTPSPSCLKLPHYCSVC